MTKSRQIHLVKRPAGLPSIDDFAVVEVNTPDAAEGEVQLRAELVSVDPYMRPRLNADGLFEGRNIGKMLVKAV